MQRPSGSDRGECRWCPRGRIRRPPTERNRSDGGRPAASVRRSSAVERRMAQQQDERVPKRLRRPPPATPVFALCAPVEPARRPLGWARSLRIAGGVRARFFHVDLCSLPGMSGVTARASHGWSGSSRARPSVRTDSSRRSRPRARSNRRRRDLLLRLQIGTSYRVHIGSGNSASVRLV